MFAKLKKWFYTKKSIIEQNEHFLQLARQAGQLVNSVNSTLQYNLVMANKMQADYNVILGGLALQYNGEISLKEEFLQIISKPDCNLDVIIQRLPEGVKVSVQTRAEQPQEEEAEDE